MKIHWLMVMFAIWFGCMVEVQAKFSYPQTEQVPIERVLKNLERQLSTAPNDPEKLYQVARIHSMVWFNESKTVEVVTNTLTPWRASYDDGIPEKSSNAPPRDTVAAVHLTNTIAYYQLAAAAVMKGTNASRWIVCPIHLGLAWTLDQAGRRQEAIKAYRKALVLAWDKEVHDQPTLKEQAEWSWDLIRAKKNPLSRPPLRDHIGPGVCYSQEIIGYLLKLLDPVKDEKEIAQLKKDKKILESMGRAITPILVSLNRDTPFAELVNPSARVQFDLDGSGLPRQWGWITPKAAWLVFDKDGTGRITSGLQMFGNVTFWIFWRNGYDALSALDDDGDGMLRGPELNGASLWEDRNGNGICDPGEVRPVGDYGVVAIDCGSQRHETGIPFNPRGIVLRDGSFLGTYDWMAPSN